MARGDPGADDGNADGQHHKQRRYGGDITGDLLLRVDPVSDAAVAEHKLSSNSG
jgi:hypothetical protein